jgi:hypothetical protein
MLVDETIARLGAVAALAGRVKGAAELSELTRTGQMPAASPFAFVLPLALTARSPGEAGAGAFVQAIDETIAVLLAVRTAGDAAGGKAVAALDALVEAVIAAVAGWGPDSEPGVFRLARGALVSANAGLVLYQIDFSCQRQLRIVA